MTVGVGRECVCDELATHRHCAEGRNCRVGMDANRLSPCGLLHGAAWGLDGKRRELSAHRGYDGAAHPLDASTTPARPNWDTHALELGQHRSEVRLTTLRARHSNEALPGRACACAAEPSRLAHVAEAVGARQHHAAAAAAALTGVEHGSASDSLLEPCAITRRGVRVRSRGMRRSRCRLICSNSTLSSCGRG